jgi:phosphoglycerol transferase MdoB-like AlkP superfamily enzyme
MNKNIIHQLELQRKDNHPLFIWALTMQNHTPYQTANYSEGFDQIKVKSDCLSKAAEDKLIAYVNGINESDRQLKNLIDYLDESNEPTVLLFFGDHLPSLYEVYEDTGMITTKVTTDWETEELLKMQSVPFFIYDNFSNTEDKKHDNLVGAAFLGNKLLNYTKTKKSSYFRFLDTLPYPALRDRLFVDKDGNYFESINSESEAKASQHKLLQYDMLYGENYVKEYEKGR